LKELLALLCASLERAKKVSEEQEKLSEEQKPNKGFSFILGMFIALAIIVLFAILFPH
jgi:predicted nucleic acid-binding Zn ribbon protein